MKWQRGQLLIELLLTIGLSAIILPGLLSSLVASRDGKPQQEQRVQATALLKESEAALKNVRDDNWTTLSDIPAGSPYHLAITNNQWSLSPGVATNAAGFTQQVVLSDVYRGSTGAIVTSPSGNTLDPSTVKAEITITWSTPNPSTLTSTMFLTRTTNLSYSHSTQAQFNAGTTVNTQITNDSGGEIKLANNNKAKWCDPEFATNSIDLPDGPPVAVAATASATTATPNDVFVATAPYGTSSAKMAYVNVTADAEIPSTSLRGTFTLDASKFSNGYSPQSITGLSNDFSTTDVRYYKSAAGNTYALLGTNLGGMEVLAVLVNDNNSANDNTNTGEYQDPVNKIYKMKTFFNTKRYAAVTSNDESPYGYGASSVAVYGDRGYVASGGYLYVFNLANIDNKSTTNGLDMYGCRIQLDGYECKPGNPGAAAKYSSGQSGTTWGDTTTPIHNDCSDGGNIELRATNDIYPVAVGSNTYVYVAIGGVTNPEFEIVNVSTIPSSTRSDDSSCGRISGGDSTWRVSSTYDFNGESGTEEAANSVFAKSDGTRAYISSNGGIDANNDGDPDSRQFYIINTSNKSSPAFLSGSPNSPTYGPSSGYYYGSGANAELYPRRSLTVLNGQRAVLVGNDGSTNGNDAEEYQVLNIDNESTPAYCSGLNFDSGFNDLTSVSEADYENYVYMVANTQANELKIIQGGPDSALYLPSGTFESQPFDTASVEPSTILRTFNRLLANVIQPSGTSVKVQVSVRGLSGGSCPSASSSYTYVGPDGDPNAFFTPTTSILDRAIPFGTYLSNAYENPQRCFRYKVTLESPDQTQTPVLQDITWNYSM
jgi:hypothetical protein